MEHLNNCSCVLVLVVRTELATHHYQKNVAWFKFLFKGVF